MDKKNYAKSPMKEFLKIPDNEKKKIYQSVSNQIGVPPQAVEKDVWVTLILRMVFSSKFQSHLIFKGGTSLSKGFSLIQRFSEDIDLGIDRQLFDFNDENLSKTQIRNLKKKCHYFVLNSFLNELSNQLNEYGINENLYELDTGNQTISDRDPVVILVKYKTLYESNQIEYLRPQVKIEVSARSLIEPNEKKTITSWIEEQHPTAPFIENSFEVNVTNPQKTFLEKIILLHEEFTKENIRSNRMSRHLYDIGQILDTDFGKDALKNAKLFDSIIDHRSKFTPMNNIKYSTLTLQNLNIIPPGEFFDLYKKDYKEMQTSMIHGDTLDFEELIRQISEKINL